MLHDIEEHHHRFREEILLDIQYLDFRFSKRLDGLALNLTKQINQSLNELLI